MSVLTVALFASAVVGQTAPPAQIKPQNTAPKPAIDREAVLKLKGEMFPDFKMKRLDDTVLTNKDLMGKVTIIDFWATWCGPCKAAAPKLEAFFKAHKEDGLQIIGANAGERGPDRQRIETKDNAVAYVAEHKYSYTFTYGNDKLFSDLKCWGYPTFFVVDQTGRVADVFVGYKQAEIEASVQGLLKKSR